MSLRGGKGNGGIRRRTDGRWEGRVYRRDPETGMNVGTSVYGSTAAAARQALREAIARLDQDQPVHDSRMTVGAWASLWIDTNLEASSRKLSTKSLYRSLMRGHVIDRPLGKVKLDQLRPSHINAWIIHLRTQTRTVKGQGGTTTQVRAQADASISRNYQVLRVCIGDAVQEGLLARNPMDKMKPPTFEKHDARFMSVTDMRRVLDAARGSKLWPMFVLIAATGIRKGEASALHWTDIDFTANTIHVRSTLQRVERELVISSPKTTSSKRLLMPAVGVFEMLRDHAKHQQLDRLRAANFWQDTGLVFTTDTGRPCDPRNVLRDFQTAAKKAEIEGVNVHSLRHSAATAMLEQGVHLKAVSEMLGHASIQITANTYGHVSPETHRHAMEELGNVLGF